MGKISDENVTKILFWLTEAIGILIIIMTLVHITSYRGGFGGRDHPDQEYYWHVFFATLGFTYLFGNALLVFRFLPQYSKPTLKLIHLGLTGSVIICALLALFFIVDMKYLTGRSHFESFHSWLGLFTIILLIVQFFTGAYAFLSTNASQPFKEWLMPWHVKIGIATFLLGGVTILTRMGHGQTLSEMLIINFTGCFVIIFSFLVLQLLSDNKLKYGHRTA